MTWDVYAVRAQGARSVEQIADGYSRPDIGDPDEVVEKVRRVAPDLDATNPRWLRLEGPDHRIDVALGNDIRVHDITFYIHDQGDAAVPIILDVCAALGITPFDTETGEMLHSSSKRPPDPPPDEDDDEDEDRPWWRRLLRR
jgi:hypothetical protein